MRNNTVYYDHSAPETQGLVPLQLGVPPLLPQIDAVANPARAVDFMLQYFGPTTIVAIQPGTGRTDAIWLYEGAKDQVSGWIEERNQVGYNIYFHPNKPKSGLKKKAKKEDIELIRALWADLDCYKGSQTMVSAWAAITALPRQPTIIIASGGGFHPYWLLREALPATAENVAQVEALGLRIATLINGDAVQNADRIMRMPFTTNYPDAKKRAVGRTVCPSGFVLA
jgi:hypothetical protein